MTATRSALSRHAARSAAGRRSRCPPRSPTLNTRSPSSTSVRSASIDSAVAPAARIAWIVATPIDRHVEPHVLLRLRDLDDAHAGPGEVSGAPDHFVGPLHRLDRDDRLVLDGDRLTDVERRDGVSHPVAEREVLALLVRRRARRSACPRRRAAAAGTRSNRAARSLRRACTSATAEISASVLRALSRVSTDSSVRSGMMPEKIFACLTWPAITACGDAGRLQDLDALAELAERHPVEVRARLARRRLEIGKRLLLDGHDGDVVAEAAGALQHQKGKPAVAGNETDSAHAARRQAALERRADRRTRASVRVNFMETSSLSERVRRPDGSRPRRASDGHRTVTRLRRSDFDNDGATAERPVLDTRRFRNLKEKACAV